MLNPSENIVDLPLWGEKQLKNGQNISNTSRYRGRKQTKRRRETCSDFNRRKTQKTPNRKQKTQKGTKKMSDKYQTLLDIAEESNLNPTEKESLVQIAKYLNLLEITLQRIDAVQMEALNKT